MLWLAELSPHEKFKEDLLHLSRSFHKLSSVLEEEIQRQLLRINFLRPNLGEGPVECVGEAFRQYH
jgi:hypothetical protein